MLCEFRLNEYVYIYFYAPLHSARLRWAGHPQLLPPPVLDLFNFILTKNKQGDKVKEALAAQKSVVELQVTERVLFDSKFTVTCALPPLSHSPVKVQSPGSLPTAGTSPYGGQNTNTLSPPWGCREKFNQLQKFVRTKGHLRTEKKSSPLVLVDQLLDPLRGFTSMFSGK